MKTKLRDLREDADLTQTELAKKLGITQRKYSYIETETQYASYEILCQLAYFYGTSVDYLLNLTDEKRPYPRRSRLG